LQTLFVDTYSSPHAELSGILPLYVFLTALTPFAVSYMHQGNRIFFACSVTTYLIVQLVRGSDATAHYDGVLQYFNVFAWQLIFVIGIWLGNWQMRGKQLQLPFTARFTLFAWAATLSSVFIRLAMTSHRIAAALFTNFWLQMSPRFVPLINKVRQKKSWVGSGSGSLPSEW
jgi:hypothetical protein